MSKNHKHRLYKKIYENFYGPIPVDAEGRSFDIHHIDGNPENNTPENLIAVTVEEHYKIHLEQNDYGAAQIIASRLKMSVDTISDLSKKTQKRRIENGTHNFIVDNPVYKQVAERTLNFFDKDFHKENNRKRIENGTHNLLHLSFDERSNIQKDRLKKGSHNFLTEWTCPHCGKQGRNQAGYVRWHGDNCKNLN